MNRLLNFLAVASSATAFLSAIWIIVPAPAPYVWLFSVAASEWSLWLGLLALFGIVCSLSAGLFYSNGRFWVLPMALGVIALIISLYPVFSILSIARQQNVSLSLLQYFGGLRRQSESQNNFATRTFANVDGKTLQMDVYLPAQNTSNNGASVIVVHGGSWNGGTRNDFPQWNKWLAAQGFTIFDIDYRLSQPNYLTATGDVKCAVRWIKEHAAEFNISPDRIALLGRSAGAHLALLAAYSADDARLPATCAESKTSEKVRAVVSLYAPVDMIWDYDNPANQRVIDGPKTLSDFLGGSPRESDAMRERYALASPLIHVNNKTPPTLLIHGGQDQLVRSENMTRLADKLTETACPYKTLFIPYAQHGFDYNFNGWGAQISQPAMLEFLQENTKPE